MEKAIYVWIDDVMFHELKILAATERTTFKKLINEIIKLGLKHYLER